MLDHDTYIPPQRGDRDGNYEWDGSAWTMVCPDCDLPMSAFNDRSRLCCAVCGLTVSEVKR